MKEKIVFKDSEGNRVVGILSDPSGDSSVPIIICAHGSTSNKDRATYTGMEERLNKAGFSSFRFDFFAHGESQGEYEDLTVTRAVDDILSAIRLLKDNGYSKIGLFGCSFGGISSIMAASKTDDLFCLALKCPVSSYQDKYDQELSETELQGWKEKGFRIKKKPDGREFRINYSFYENIDKNDGYKAAERINIPTFIVHGSADKTVPVEQSKNICSMIHDCKLEIIEGADHRFSGSGHFARMMQLVSGFLIDQCKKQQRSTNNMHED
ncbi:prolyl oligopeptidase family serine peptidase [Candidatus Woesearchaeota archaeon]|nr:prolyl oligopeptidase family serine peptidase [Candidatus Woesearchaeota archaeon]